MGPLGKPLSGVAVCERILQFRPNLGAAHRRLIFFYAITLQRAKVVAQARACIEQGGELPETYVQLMAADGIDVPDAYEWVTKWLRSDPENERFLVARAFHYTGAKGLREAADRTTTEASSAKTAAGERLLTDTLTQFPRNPELLAYFLQRGCQLEDPQRVAALLVQAPEEAKQDYRFWRFRGWLHRARHEDSPAADDLRQALRLNPYDWRSARELAVVLRRSGRAEEAESLEARASTGQNLQPTLQQFINVSFLPATMLQRLADYARLCQDEAVAERLAQRISARRE
jgi:tetratricopeptide (TPR) repeat protein